MSSWSSQRRNLTPEGWSDPTAWAITPTFNPFNKKVECEPDCPFCAAEEGALAEFARRSKEYEEELFQEMTPEDDEPYTFEDAFARIFDHSFDVLVEKQEAYGPKNIEELDFFGTFSRLASDKINRIRNLMKGEVVNGNVYVQFPLDLEETVEDTLTDIMNYAAILIALRKGWWGKPLKADAFAQLEEDQ